MTWIKICGITNLEDALAAVEAGADALGFVFYDQSPRRVDARRVREIGKQIPMGIEKIGVFVMASEVELEFMADEAQLTGWQLHKNLNGTAPEDALRKGDFIALPKCKSHPGKDVYISLPAGLLLDEKKYRGFGCSTGADNEVSALFIDSGHGELPGGTGQTFNWERMQQAIQCLSLQFKVVVAGGLTPRNVSEAMSILHPWGVDVSSGVETKPGKKDPEKMRAFIKAVREADKANSK
jgi:phosphoribosylanthranilate isomerase